MPSCLAGRSRRVQHLLNLCHIRIDLDWTIRARRRRFRLAVKLQQDLRVLEKVSRQDAHHHVSTTDDAARRQLAYSSDARRARRLATDPRCIDKRLRLE